MAQTRVVKVKIEKARDSYLQVELREFYVQCTIQVNRSFMKEDGVNRVFAAESTRPS